VFSSWLIVLPDSTQANWSHVQQTVLGDYVMTTAILAAGILLLTLPLGVGAAWYVTQYEFLGRKTVRWLLVMPMAMPGYISAFAYGAMFDFAGPLQSALRDITGLERGEYWFPQVRSVGGAIWVLGFAMLPYVYLLSCAAFSGQSAVWREVAQSLNVNRTRFFWKVALPAARPFIAASAALVLMETLADIGTVGVLAVPTISSGIYRAWAYMHEPLIAARMAVILLIGAIIVLVLERSSRKRMMYSVRDLQPLPMRPTINGGNLCFALLCCWLPIMAGFLFPFLYLLRMLFFTFHMLDYTLLTRDMLDTLVVCSAAGMLICCFSLAVVLAQRKQTWWLRYGAIAANLGYALPGVVLAVGLLMLMGWLREITSVMLIGSLFTLLMALVIRYLAVGYNPLHSASTRISSEMDMAAASLGSNDWDIVRRVYLPLLRIPLCTAFLLVVLDVMKELPLTLILRPFGFKTLAVSAYDFASDDRAAQAAPFAITLIVLASIAIFLLQFIQRQERSYGQYRSQ
jgi:iron(III) transport system permease protein